MASTTAQVSINARGTEGGGTTVDFTSAKSRVTMVLVVNSTVSEGIVTVEASQDGTNWVTLHAFGALTGGNAHYSHRGGAFRYWRANVTRAVAGGGSITATFMEAD